MNLTHPNSPDVKAALETKCCVCHEPPGVYCPQHRRPRQTTTHVQIGSHRTRHQGETMNEHPPVDPRPYDRATAIITWLQVIAFTAGAFLVIGALAFVIDLAMTAFQGAVCK